LLPAGAVAGWGLHPLESAAFARRTPRADIASHGLIQDKDAAVDLCRQCMFALRVGMCRPTNALAHAARHEAPDKDLPSSRDGQTIVLPAGSAR